MLSERVEKKQERIEKLDEKITVKEKARATIAEVDAMGKSAFFGGYNVSADELVKLKALAKKSVTINDPLAAMRRRLDTVKQELTKLQTALASMTRERDVWKQRHEQLFAEVKDFLSAIRNFPQKLHEFINAHWRERAQQQSHKRDVSR
jgi:chromosome segregation ATPase